MANRAYDLAGNNLGKLAQFAAETGALKDPTKFLGNKDGSLASSLTPGKNGGNVDVVNNYMWTLSNAKLKGEIPYIRLIEYKCNESEIGRNVNFYVNLANVGTSGEEREILEVYQGVFSKQNPTGFNYTFPYFNQTGFELSTQDWKAVDSIGESLNSASEGLQDVLGGLGAQKSSEALKKLTGGLNTVAGIGKAAIAKDYPVVGVQDRPLVFAGHTNRSITISFPLYNTVKEADWQDNRDLIYLLMSQNLFNKRDYITGVPPVFYDVFIPGQYYCYAAQMSDIKVENLGNQRLLYDDFVVPDAYSVTLTLKEMVMPSKNQFEAVMNGSARNFVNATTNNKLGKVASMLSSLADMAGVKRI